MPQIDVTLPIKLQSPNVQEHWSKRHKRNHVHALLIKQNVPIIQKVELPCKIMLERSGTKLFDSDNYIASCKGVKDTLASLILKKKRGTDDDNPQIAWEYKQIKGKIGLRIVIDW